MTCAAGPVSAFALDATYIGPTGLWSDPTNWSTGAAPATADAIQLVQSGTDYTIVTFDADSPGSNFASITTDYTGANGMMIFNQASNTLSVTTELVGFNGVGQINLSGGTHTIHGAGSNGLFVGFNFGSSGTVNLSGTTLNVADSVYIGYSGNGTFNHTAGKNLIGGYLVLGGEASGTSVAGTGIYNFSDGNITANTVYVGLSGTGTFNHTGGSSLYGGISIGYLPGSSGVYTLSAGSVFTLGSETYGDQGTGQFNQSGGDHTNSGLYLGNTITGSGALNFSAGIFTVEGAEIVGNAGHGSVSQSGGLHTAELLAVGLQGGSTGSVGLTDGTLSIAGNEYLGYYGSATFIQDGGTHLINTYLSMGRIAGSTSSYTLNNGVLSCPRESIAYNSKLSNVFTQNGGTNIAGVFLAIGEQNASQGTYNLLNGDLQVGTLYAGFIGNGDFNQTGGNVTASTLYVGTFGPSNGTVNLSGGVLTVTGSEEIGSGGKGIFNHSGGIHSVSGTMTISSSPGGAGIYNQSGGVLTAGQMVNNGKYILSGGAAVLGSLTGSGTTLVDGLGITTPTLAVGRFAQTAVTIGQGSTLTVTEATPRVTNSVKTLTINPTGLLDLQNHFLTVDNTTTPFPVVKQYIDTAYNLNGVGNSNSPIAGDYNGSGGITSSVAKASYANDLVVSIGYYNGALQNPANPDNVGQILGPNSNSGLGTGIPRSQILVRPTLTGDLNGDGVVNSYDVNLFNSFGLFNQNTNLGWQAGDLNGDGVVDAKDVAIFNSAGNFNNGSYLVATASAKAAKAASTLTGRSASPATAELNPASGTMAFTYDPATGDVHVSYNGFTGFAGKQTFNTTTRALSLIDILSTGGPFVLDATKLTAEAKLALSSPTITGNSEINLTAVNGFLPDGTDLGRILASGLDPAQLANALTLTFNYTGSRQLSGGVAGLIVPEPTTLSLLGLGALGLLSRRRRKTIQSAMN